MRLLRRRLLVSVLVLIGATVTGIAQQPEKVYVTKTGTKYHRATCSSLSKSKIEMPLAQAAARYGACKICKPPLPSATPASTAGATAAPAAVPARVVPKSAPAPSSRWPSDHQEGHAMLAESAEGAELLLAALNST